MSTASRSLRVEDNATAARFGAAAGAGAGAGPGWAGRLQEAEAVISNAIPDAHFALVIAELYRQRLLRLQRGPGNLPVRHGYSLGLGQRAFVWRRPAQFLTRIKWLCRQCCQQLLQVGQVQFGEETPAAVSMAGCVGDDEVHGAIV